MGSFVSTVRRPKPPKRPPPGPPSGGCAASGSEGTSARQAMASAARGTFTTTGNANFLMFLGGVDGSSDSGKRHRLCQTCDGLSKDIGKLRAGIFLRVRKDCAG